MGHTDIKTEGWVGRLPMAARPYALLMRLDRPTGWWLLLLPGWWSILLAANSHGGMEGYDWYLMIIFLIGAVIMRGAGCIINDIWDRDLDKQVERTRARPLASGDIKIWQAATLLFFLLFMGLLILLQTSALCVWLGFLSMIFVVGYPYMKRITWWPQAFLGVTFNFGALMGWAAVMHGLALPALFLYIGGFFWTLGYDTIYAHQDKDDDEMVGIKSTALLLGTRSKMCVAGFYNAAWLSILCAALSAGLGIIPVMLLLLPAAHLLWQLQQWDPDDAESSLRIFKSNRDFGLLVVLAFIISGF